MQQHSKKDPSNQELCFKQHPKESLDPPKGQGLTLFFRRVLAFAHLSEKNGRACQGNHQGWHLVGLGCQVETLRLSWGGGAMKWRPLGAHVIEQIFPFFPYSDSRCFSEKSKDFKGNPKDRSCDVVNKETMSSILWWSLLDSLGWIRVETEVPLSLLVGSLYVD